MTFLKKYKKSLYYSSLCVAFPLLLSACGTTSNAPISDDLSQIDKVLERAAYDANAQGQVVESIEIIEKIYKRRSEDPEVAMRYAMALRHIDRLERASLVLSPFVKSPDAPAGTLIEYASLQSAMGNYSAAEQYARKAVLKAPETGKAYHVLGIALDAQGFHEQAEVSFRKGLEHWSGDPSPILNNLGLNLAAQGFLDEALEVLRRANAAAPQRREIERNLRIVSALQNKPGSQGYVDHNAPRPLPKPLQKGQNAPVEKTVAPEKVSEKSVLKDEREEKSLNKIVTEIAIEETTSGEAIVVKEIEIEEKNVQEKPLTTTTIRLND